MPSSNHDSVSVLKRELAFLDSGGYSAGWRLPLIFEDSLTCQKGIGLRCQHTNCVLLPFVPVSHRTLSAPCRHIPLNKDGETVDSLYRTGTQAELEEAVRQWLVATISAFAETAEVCA